MKAFVSGVIYFARTESMGQLFSDGSFNESGGNWKCGSCLMVIEKESTPQEHATKHHPSVDIAVKEPSE
jgi:hypothetical protein